VLQNPPCVLSICHGLSELKVISIVLFFTADADIVLCNILDPIHGYDAFHRSIGFSDAGSTLWGDHLSREYDTLAFYSSIPFQIFKNFHIAIVLDFKNTIGRLD
jgi:hypothetical protein